jgi:hypothetical protein
MRSENARAHPAAPGKKSTNCATITLREAAVALPGCARAGSAAPALGMPDRRSQWRRLKKEEDKGMVDFSGD